MARKQFTFYRSFWDAVKGLNQKDRLSALDAICAYALDGDERKMTPTAAGMFVLIKPVLDSAEKKSVGGKRPTSNKEDNGKITASKAEDSRKEKEGEKEKEVEKEVEVENECYNPYSTSSACARAASDSSALAATPNQHEAVAYFLDRINPMPSSVLRAELLDFCEALGDEVVLHALHIAVDERKTAWSYIKAILNRYKADGLKDISAVMDAEAQHAAQKDEHRTGKSAKPFTAETRRATADDDKAMEQIERLIAKMQNDTQGTRGDNA